MKSNRDPMLWWAIPGKLAGMPMPLVDTRRVENGGALRDHDDDLPALWDAGIRTVISLIHTPRRQKVYEDAGFAYLSSPVPDGEPPTFDQMGRVINFYRASPSAAAVHCHAGLGRTGTIVAACLMSEGHYVRDAIRIVRGARPGTIETSSQSSFLHSFQHFLDEK